MIANTIDSHISDSAVVIATAGDVLLTAVDGGEIKAISGAAAILSSEALGAAFATNDIETTVRTYIDGATVTTSAAGGKVELEAASTAKIRALAIGVSQADRYASVAGSAPLNEIANTIEERNSGNFENRDGVTRSRIR